MQIKNVRFIIAAITTFSAYAVYVSRVNLSIAIIAMVDDGHHTNSHVSDAHEQQSSSSPQALAAAAATQQLNASAIVGGNVDRTTAPLTPANFNQSSMQQPLSLNASTPPPPSAVQQKLIFDGKPQQHQETFTGTFPASKKSILKAPLISQEKFRWDQTDQGHILGAFFYGYILFQIPGARMAESVGARWILMAATAGSAIISLVFPLSTQLNSIHLLMVLRFVMGLCQSAFFPAAYVFFCRWLPEHERSVLLPIMFIGSNMGSISTYIMSSYLISSSYGWPSVFYVSGLICTLVTVLWFVFGSNGPQDNWLITRAECDYITKNLTTNGSSSNSTSNHKQQQLQKQQATRASNLANKCDNKITRTAATKAAPASRFLNKSKSANDLIPTANQLSHHPDVSLSHNGGAANNCCQSAPEPVGSPVGLLPEGVDASTAATSNQLSWRKLLGSLPIWVLILSMYGNEWSQVVLTYELPTYLNTALSFPIEQNGVINSFFQLSYTVASPILSSLGVYMLDKNLLGMQKLHVRKLFQSLATFGQLACFVSVPICGANRGLIIMFMFSATVFKACANAGDIMVPGDLSPEYAGTIFAFANSIGNTAGFFVPLLAGFIVRNAYEREQWTPFWMTTATIMGCSGLIFLVFGETKRQNFSIDDDDATDDGHDDVESCPLAAMSRATTTKPSDRQLTTGKQRHREVKV